MAGRLRAASKFYRFLWEVRGELFSPDFEQELIASYRPRGQDPCPAAMLAMVMLLQRYDGLSDADAVDAAENDRRWQLVLGTLESERAPFGQGTLVRFRTRMMAHDLDKKLVHRTVELAKTSGAFGFKKLRVALDSSPLHGAGRVEDTWNLIGRAMSKVVHAVSLALDVEEQDVISQAKLSALSADSIKAALDIDWDDDDAQHQALNKLVDEVSRLEAWVEKRAAVQSKQSPLQEALALLRRVVTQDTEPDPPNGGVKLIDGVATDRVISIGDVQMRHGRKSKSKRFDGYKRHIAVVDRLIVATAIEPANVREHAPAEALLRAVERHGDIDTLDIDRGYLASPAVEALHRAGATIHSRAWQGNNHGLFTKEDFDIDLKRGRVTCPAGVIAPITPAGHASFDEAACSACSGKARCTTASGRSLSIHRFEDLLIQLRRKARSPNGRAELRKRVVVEHKLARISAIQGNRARFRTARKNEIDINCAASIANLYEIASLRAA